MYSGVKKRMVGERLYAVIAFFAAIVSIFISPSLFVGKVLSVITMGLVLYPLIKSIKTSDYHLTILLTFMMGYVIVPLNYYWLGMHINMYQEAENESTVYRVLQILCMFHSVLLYKMKFSASCKKFRISFAEHNNTVYGILILISFIFITFGSSGKTIFETGSYGESLQVKQSSATFAYSVIPISLAYIYSSTSTRRYITYVIAAYFCLKDLALGGRVDSLELLLALFFIRFQYVWSKKMIIFAAVTGALFFAVWGVLRSDVNVGFINALSNIFSDGGGGVLNYQTGNSAEVYYSSLRIIYMIEEGVLDWLLRLHSFFYFFISSAVPYSMLPDYANLGSYLHSTYWSGGGGLGPVFFFAFGSWIGVIVFGLFVAYCMNLFLNAKYSKYVHFYAILVLATTPRWYAYYPIQLIKFCLLGMVLYILLNKLFRTSNSGIYAPNYKRLRQ